jgi:hypothetical protein
VSSTRAWCVKSFSNALVEFASRIGSYLTSATKSSYRFFITASAPSGKTPGLTSDRF